MTNIKSSRNTSIKSRLLKRIDKIADLKAKPTINNDLKRPILITTYDQAKFKTETIEFDSLVDATQNKEFFPGYFQEKIHTISSLVFSLSNDAASRFESKYSSITFLRSELNKNSNSKTYIVPLSKDIFEQQTLNNVVTAINYEISSNINITFDTLTYNPTLQFIKIYNSTLSAGSSFLDVSTTIKRHKNQLQQSVSQKNVQKLEQLNLGLYKVKRFNSEAEASSNAAQNNDNFFKSPKPLKAPFSLKQVKEYSESLDVAAQSAIGLGIKEKYLKEVYKGQHTSTVFPCLLKEGGDAVIYINKNLESKYFGKLGYKSLSTGDRFTMAELYARLLSPDEEVNKPTLMALQMKLLENIGLIQCEEKNIRIPKDLTPKQLCVLHGFNQLLRLKQSVRGQEGDPILFTYSFASLWCGVSRITATSAIKKLVLANVIYIADKTKHLVSYLFTKIESIKDIVKTAAEQTNEVKQVICEDIKEKYRQSKGYVKAKIKDHKRTLRSLEDIKGESFSNEKQKARKQKGFRCNETPSSSNFRQTSLL